MSLKIWKIIKSAWWSPKPFFFNGPRIESHWKSSVQIEEKKRIAHKAATLISEGESIFLGPGTTIQFLAEQLTGRNIRVITNSLAVFNILVNHAPTEVILTGGDYRDNTNTFVGPITNLVLGKLKYNKAFISCNGIYNSSITTYSLEEGESQQIALDNSKINIYWLIIKNSIVLTSIFIMIYLTLIHWLQTIPSMKKY